MPFRSARRIPRVAVATILFLVVALDSPPTTSSISETRPEPPSPEELAVLDELLGWIGTGDSEFEIIRPADIVAAIRERPQSFALFHSWNGPENRDPIIDRMPYGTIIRRAARRHSVDELLVAAIVEAESSFNAMAMSPVGAVGLMQVMPATAARYGDVDPWNPAVNVDLGARYLSRMLNRFGGDLELALAAYNAGPGAVDRYDGMPPYRETRAYVGKVLSRYVDYHQRAWQDSRAEDWLLY
jgi:hypothetical protein